MFSALSLFASGSADIVKRWQTSNCLDCSRQSCKVGLVIKDVAVLLKTARKWKFDLVTSRSHDLLNYLERSNF
jgi:hypothetical protein